MNPPGGRQIRRHRLAQRRQTARVRFGQFRGCNLRTARTIRLDHVFMGKLSNAGRPIRSGSGAAFAVPAPAGNMKGVCSTASIRVPAELATTVPAKARGTIAPSPANST